MSTPPWPRPPFCASTAPSPSPRTCRSCPAAQPAGILAPLVPRRRAGLGRAHRRLAVQRRGACCATPPPPAWAWPRCASSLAHPGWTTAPWCGCFTWTSRSPHAHYLCSAHRHHGPLGMPGLRRVAGQDRGLSFFEPNWHLTQAGPASAALAFEVPGRPRRAGGAFTAACQKNHSTAPTACPTVWRHDQPQPFRTRHPPGRGGGRPAPACARARPAVECRRHHAVRVRRSDRLPPAPAGGLPARNL